MKKELMMKLVKASLEQFSSYESVVFLQSKQWRMENNAKVVDKSQIKDLKFSNKDVLVSTQEAFLRELDLERALRLGNRVKHKVKIFFKANESVKYVETTIWSADSNYISLKGGITIPVTSIYRVQL